MRRIILAIALCVWWLPGLLPGESAAQRIVSTSPSITETLFALNLGARVVGVSTYCTFPPEVRKLPKVGTFLKPDPEAIARLNPDLVVLQRMSSELTNRLDALHIRHIEVQNATLDDIYSEIHEMAAAAGVPENANRLVGQIQQSLRSIENESARLPKTRVLLIVGRRPGTLSDLVAVGPDSYLNRLIEIAGGSNVLNRAGLPAYPQISLETVMREDPDVIIDLTGMEESQTDRQEERAETLSLWHERSELSAVKRNRVYEVSSTVFIIPGPRVTEAAQELFRYLHSDGTSQ